MEDSNEPKYTAKMFQELINNMSDGIENKKPTTMPHTPPIQESKEQLKYKAKKILDKDSEYFETKVLTDVELVRVWNDRHVGTLTRVLNTDYIMHEIKP